MDTRDCPDYSRVPCSVPGPDGTWPAVHCALDVVMVSSITDGDFTDMTNRRYSIPLGRMHSSCEMGHDEGL